MLPSGPSCGLSALHLTRAGKIDNKASYNACAGMCYAVPAVSWEQNALFCDRALASARAMMHSVGRMRVIVVGAGCSPTRRKGLLGETQTWPPKPFVVCTWRYIGRRLTSSEQKVFSFPT